MYYVSNSTERLALLLPLWKNTTFYTVNASAFLPRQRDRDMPTLYAKPEVNRPSLNRVAWIFGLFPVAFPVGVFMFFPAKVGLVSARSLTAPFIALLS